MELAAASKKPMDVEAAGSSEAAGTAVDRTSKPSRKSRGLSLFGSGRQSGAFPAYLTTPPPISEKPDLQGDKPTVLWRGMRGLMPSDKFLKHGGCEIAPMSTTKELSIAVRYATAADNEAIPSELTASLRLEKRRKTALLFRLRIESIMEVGADLSFLSAFPHEEEVCPATRS